MFKKLSNSLLSPKEVSKYYGESFGKTFVFFLLLLFFIMIPSVMSVILTEPLNSDRKKNIKKLFINEEIPFVIENGELSNVEGKDNYVYTNKGLETIHIIVTEDPNNATAPLDGMAFVFAKDGVYVMYSLIGEKIFEYNDYEYLKNLDLSNKELLKDINFWDNIFSIADSVINEGRPTFIIFNIFYYLFYWVCWMLFFTFILTVFSKLKTGNYLKFFSIFKVTIYNLTPFIICLVFATLFNLGFLIYLGYILSAVYNVLTINETLKRLYLTRNEGE